MMSESCFYKGMAKDFKADRDASNAALLRCRAELNHIRQSLQARLEGRNEGGYTEVMRLVDEIAKKERLKVLSEVVRLRQRDYDPDIDDGC